MKEEEQNHHNHSHHNYLKKKYKQAINSDPSTSDNKHNKRSCKPKCLILITMLLLFLIPICIFFSAEMVKSSLLMPPNSPKEEFNVSEIEPLQDLDNSIVEIEVINGTEFFAELGLGEAYNYSMNSTEPLPSPSAYLGRHRGVVVGWNGEYSGPSNNRPRFQTRPYQPRRVIRPITPLRPVFVPPPSRPILYEAQEHRLRQTRKRFRPKKDNYRLSSRDDELYQSDRYKIPYVDEDEIPYEDNSYSRNKKPTKEQDPVIYTSVDGVVVFPSGRNPVIRIRYPHGYQHSNQRSNRRRGESAHAPRIYTQLPQGNFDNIRDIIEYYEHTNTKRQNRYVNNYDYEYDNGYQNNREATLYRQDTMRFRPPRRRTESRRKVSRRRKEQQSMDYGSQKDKPLQIMLDIFPTDDNGYGGKRGHVEMENYGNNGRQMINGYGRMKNGYGQMNNGYGQMNNDYGQMDNGYDQTHDGYYEEVDGRYYDDMPMDDPYPPMTRHRYTPMSSRPPAYISYRPKPKVKKLVLHLNLYPEDDEMKGRDKRTSTKTKKENRPVKTYLSNDHVYKNIMDFLDTMTSMQDMQDSHKVPTIQNPKDRYKNYFDLQELNLEKDMFVINPMERYPKKTTKRLTTTEQSGPYEILPTPLPIKEKT